ncbi:hypothetical protein [Hymenobacter aerophilus]|uniref:hypothetical protein n=1 Tax=Hymenobacter aerophilus TaxID=119644 RepID=UPI00037856F2|nr:hypothetical protein [Hymenobacter aerophilus]
MNYVQHTRTAHERLTHQPDARPHHVSLYWALFFDWNAARFPACLDLDHQQLMQAAHIGSRHTYRDALRELTAWGLIAYQPSRSRHERSSCSLTDLSGPEVTPVNAAIRVKSGPDKNPLPGPEVAQALRPEVAAVNGLSGPEVAQASLYGKTKDVNSVVENRSGGGPQKKIEVLEGEGLSSAEVLDGSTTSHEPVPAASAASKKTPRVERGAPKQKGGQAGKIQAAATAQNTEDTHKPRAGRRKLPEATFQESAIYDKQAFTAAFQGTDYELADLNFYHEKVNIWRDKKTGEPPRRADWVATAKRFMLNDAEDNRLKLAPAPAPQFGAGNSHGHPGGPDTGYRTSRWD